MDTLKAMVAFHDAALTPYSATRLRGSEYVVNHASAKMGVRLTASDSSPGFVLTVHTGQPHPAFESARVTFAHDDYDALNALLQLYAARDWEAWHAAT